MERGLAEQAQQSSVEISGQSHTIHELKRFRNKSEAALVAKWRHIPNLAMPTNWLVDVPIILFNVCFVAIWNRSECPPIRTCLFAGI